MRSRRSAYIPDSSAAEPHYFRNKIRHDLVALLQKDYNPRIVQTLNRLSELLRSDNEILDQMVREIVDPVLLSRDEQEVSCSVDVYYAGIPGRSRAGL